MPTKCYWATAVYDGSSLMVGGTNKCMGEYSHSWSIGIQSLVWYTASSLPYPYELQCPIIFEKCIHLIAGHDTHGPTKTVLRCFLPLLAMSSLTQLATLELCLPNMHKPSDGNIYKRWKKRWWSKTHFSPYKPHPCMLRPIQTTQQYRDKHKREFSSWVVEHRR